MTDPLRGGLLSSLASTTLIVARRSYLPGLFGHLSFARKGTSPPGPC